MLILITVTSVLTVLNQPFDHKLFTTNYSILLTSDDSKIY